MIHVFWGTKAPPADDYCLEVTTNSNSKTVTFVFLVASAALYTIHASNYTELLPELGLRVCVHNYLTNLGILSIVIWYAESISVLANTKCATRNQSVKKYMLTCNSCIQRLMAFNVLPATHIQGPGHNRKGEYIQASNEALWWQIGSTLGQPFCNASMATSIDTHPLPIILEYRKLWKSFVTHLIVSSFDSKIRLH